MPEQPAPRYGRAHTSAQPWFILESAFGDEPVDPSKQPDSLIGNASVGRR
jgi:hypothetical protein